MLAPAALLTRFVATRPREDPERVVAEVSRFFFYTFNRTWQSQLIVIKGVEWFVDNTPKDLHVLRMFVKPEELAGMCRAQGLAIEKLHGSRPRFRWPLWRMVLTGKVGDDFAFTFTPSTKLGYTGFARKATQPSASARRADLLAARP